MADKPPLFTFSGSYQGKLIPTPNPENAWYFYQTYGFPVEMWIEEFNRKIKEGDFDWFNAHYQESVNIWQKKVN